MTVITPCGSHTIVFSNTAHLIIYSYFSAMCFVTTGTCVYVYLNPEEHVAQNPKLPYWKNRTKPYPWKECSDCGFLDMPCWIECRKENKAKEDAAKGVTNEGH